MPGKSLGISHNAQELISQLQQSLESGGTANAQLRHTDSGETSVQLNYESKALRLGLNIITLGIYGSVKDQQVKSALIALLQKDHRTFESAGQKDSAHIIQSAITDLQRTNSSKLFSKSNGILDQIKQSNYLAHARILPGEQARSRSSSGASLKSAIDQRYETGIAPVGSNTSNNHSSDETQAAQALTRLRASLEFSKSENGIALTIKDKGKQTLQAGDFKYLATWVKEQGLSTQSQSEKVKQSNRITSFDLSAAKHLTQESLSDIGDQLPYLSQIRAENCPHLTELDHIKKYVQQYFVGDKNTSQSHRAILQYLDKSLFRSGTQHTYFQELKFKYARENLLGAKFINPADGSKAKLNQINLGKVVLSAHQRDCASIILQDIYEHKFHEGHADADLPNSHNGATRATLTHEDVQLLNSGLADIQGLDSAGKPVITEHARSDIKAELNRRVTGFVAHLDEVQASLLLAIPDKIDVPGKPGETSTRIDNPYKQIDHRHPLAPKSINYGALLQDLKSSDPVKRQTAAQIAVIIKAAGLDFADKQGRNFALSDIEKIGRELNLDTDLSKTLSAITTLSDTFSPEIDDATLQYLVQENRKAASHPRVGIVGGGPTGLFAGLEFFAKGADVKISESRDALYTRHQIVRLDPLWVNKLKFYLGTDFEKYYGADDNAYTGVSKPKIGNRSGDGFVETVINHLEARLLDRVVLLNSLAESQEVRGHKSPNGKPVSPGITVLAAHEVESKVEAKDGEPFVLKSLFKQKSEALKEETNQVGVDAQNRPIYETALAGGSSDPYQFQIWEHGIDQNGNAVKRLASDSNPPIEVLRREKEYILADGKKVPRVAGTNQEIEYQFGEEIPVDLVFDCAGKHSHFKMGNSLSRDVTVSEPHIVASFFVRGECLSYRQENHDFRRQYLITPDFIEKTNTGIKKGVDDFIESIFIQSEKTGSIAIGEKTTLESGQFSQLGGKVYKALLQAQQQYINVGLDAYARIPVQDGIRKDPQSAEGEKSLVYETRTFINTSNDFAEAPGALPRQDGGVAKQADGIDRPDNIVYLGLEVPRPISNFQQELQRNLISTLEAEIPDAGDRTSFAKRIVSEANLGFIMAIANEQGLDRPRTSEPGSAPWVSAANADRKFLAAFDVSQGSVPNGVITRTDPATGRVLIQASGGDSAASPHFMRYSGLSGAREHVGIIGGLVGKIASTTQGLSAQTIQSEAAVANKNYSSINEFVLSRGKVFLASASSLDIAKNVRAELNTLLSPTSGNLLGNVRSQAEAASILRSQLKDDLDKIYEPDVSAAEKAVWSEIDEVIARLEAGTYQHLEAA